MSFERLNEIRLRLKALVHRGRLERDLEDEFAFHLLMREEKCRIEGIASGDPRRAAQRRFGNETWLKERCRELWTFVSLDILVQDLRYGLRTIVKDPAFAIVAVLTLAVGIGANATIFSLVDSFLIRPLAVSHPDEL
ncbi:MAG TPA: hypothetical protein VJX67_10000, partial [Blastocatellia bacterium]|nr:hypothetical protein [Blastocatellia bacterium]